MKIHPARQLGQRGVRLADQQFPELVLPPRREAALAPPQMGRRHQRPALAKRLADAPHRRDAVA